MGDMKSVVVGKMNRCWKHNKWGNFSNDSLNNSALRGKQFTYYYPILLHF